MTIDSRSLLLFMASLMFGVATMFTAPAYARTKTTPAPTIDQFYVEPADQFAPGSELNFTIEGTPGGTASVRLTGIKRNVPLTESDSGVYEGSYTVRTRDRLSAASTVRATLKVKGKSAIKSQPLGGLGATAASAEPGSAPAATGTGTGAARLALVNFTAAPVSAIEPGVELKFTMNGSAGAKASFTIENIARDVPMREVKPGQYEGSYTVRRGDKFPANPMVTGMLEAGGQSNRMRLAQPLVQAASAAAAAVRNVSPRDRETVSTNPVVISGTFDDAAGIDPRTVRILVAGNDVTANAVVTPQLFTYRTELRPGGYPVEVHARDKAGKAVRHAWSFTVSPLAATSAMSFPLEVVSPANNAEVPGGAVEVRGRTAPNADVAVTVQASAALAGAFGLNRQIFNERGRADAAGNFSFTFQSPLPVPGTRFDVGITATKDGQTKNTTLVLVQQR